MRAEQSRATRTLMKMNETTAFVLDSQISNRSMDCLPRQARDKCSEIEGTESHAVSAAPQRARIGVCVVDTPEPRRGRWVRAGAAEAHADRHRIRLRRVAAVVAGVVASDVDGVGTARYDLAAVSYGSSGQAMFAYGQTGSKLSLKNLVSSSGVVASDTTGVGTARSGLGASKYGTGLAAFAYGNSGSYVNVKNLVNSSGVIGSDVSGVGTARNSAIGTSYGGDKGIFAYGYAGGASGVSMSNLLNNLGVIGSDVSGVGSTRYSQGAAGYSTSA